MTEETRNETDPEAGEWEEQKAPPVTVGVSGFSYDDWIGPVYPEGIKKDDMLPYYANELGFSMVELNFSYYTQPSVKTMESLISKTPDDFEFVIKAHQDLTHRLRDDKGLFIRNETAMETFRRGIAPMVESGRLVAVLAQFPQKFSKTEDAIEHLKWFARSMNGLNLVVEIRSASWVSQSFFDLLKELDVGYCIADGPTVAKLPSYTPVVTSGLAYFRFHGRNQNWFGVPTDVRYDYRYSDSELRSFIEPVTRIAKKAPRTLVFFNNHFQGSAVANATEFRKMVGGR